jgi:hypothetical protein
MSLPSVSQTDSERETIMKDPKAIQEVVSLSLGLPDLQDPKLRKVGEGVYYIDTVRFARIVWHRYWINLKDQYNGDDWADTTVTEGITLGGGRQGRDHWGWPHDQGFAQDYRGEVRPDGYFFYALEDVGESPIVGSAFRWIRRGVHGATGVTWDASAPSV